jgi:hypothetical protein
MTPFDSRWPAGTLQLLVRLQSNEVFGRDMANWGVEALGAGLDSPALRRLAGMAADATPSRFDAEPLFRAAARELGMPDFTKEDILLAFMDECAQQIAGGAANLEQLLQKIHETVVDPLDHREDLMPWCYARSGFREGIPRPVSDDDVRALARAWLDGRTESRIPRP